MKPRELPWKWLLLGLGVLGLGAALLPRLIGDTAQLGDRTVAHLSTWIGGEVKLTGPVKISYFPDISVTAGLRLEGSKRLPMVQSIVVEEAKISLDLADLLRGRISVDALKLTRPVVTLAETGAPPVPGGAEPQTLAAGFADGVPVSAVHVRAGELIVPTAAGPETVKNINAHFDASGRAGSVSGFGKLVWRDEAIRFALDSGTVANAADGPELPIALTLNSDPFKARISGTASLDHGFGLDGDMQAEVDDVRRLLVWMGIPVAEGQGLKGLTASGAFHLAGPSLSFDDGTFSLDGNNAVGLLAVTAGPRPRVEGTLAFDRLTLDPYLAASQTDAGQRGAPSPSVGSPFDWPLVRYLDADLRLSAGEINAGALKLGRGAITVTAKQGVIVGELGELELCGGSAAGRAGLDLTQPAKRLTLIASLTDITAESCLQQLALGIPFKGVGRLKTEVATEGRDGDELLKALSGSLKVSARDGVVPVDFSRLVQEILPLEGQSWSGTDGTAYGELNADCRLAGGHIWCQTFTMQTPSGLISGSGDIDLPRQTLDWDVAVTGSAEAVKTTPAAQVAPKVSIRGSLSQPSIKRADRSTLGDGSPQAGPLVPSASPH
jgi:AsmA protein